VPGAGGMWGALLSYVWVAIFTRLSSGEYSGVFAVCVPYYTKFLATCYEMFTLLHQVSGHLLRNVHLITPSFWSLAMLIGQNLMMASIGRNM
jgi:hypothetical protein